MLTKIKKKVQYWLRIEADLAHRIGLTPNHISLLGVIFGVSSGLAYWISGITIPGSDYFTIGLLVAVFLIILSGFCDALDGALARIHNTTSIIGGFVDSLLDRYVDAAIYCGIILGGLCKPFWGLSALIGSLLTSYTRARSEAANISMETIGLVERAERLLLVITASLLNILWPDTLGWAMILLSFMTNITVLQRSIYFLKKANIKEQ